jgi:hypothetical protein
VVPRPSISELTILTLPDSTSTAEPFVAHRMRLFVIVTPLAATSTHPEMSSPLIAVPGVVMVRGPLARRITPAGTPVPAAFGNSLALRAPWPATGGAGVGAFVGTRVGVGVAVGFGVIVGLAVGFGAAVTVGITFVVGTDVVLPAVEVSVPTRAAGAAGLRVGTG